jgi:hypothetical protein
MPKKAGCVFTSGTCCGRSKPFFDYYSAQSFFDCYSARSLFIVAVLSRFSIATIAHSFFCCYSARSFFDCYNTQSFPVVIVLGHFSLLQCSTIPRATVLGHSSLATVLNHSLLL